jgi:hypothetical protein
MDINSNFWVSFNNIKSFEISQTSWDYIYNTWTISVLSLKRVKLGRRSLDVSL